MSSTNSTEEEPVAVYSKPRANVYTVLLVMSLLAILVGIVFLWLYMDEYQWKTKGGLGAALPRGQAPLYALHDLK